MTRELLLAAGIDPGQPRTAAAALLARGAVLRCDRPDQAAPLTAIERGWFSGPSPLAVALALVTGAKIEEGAAFAGAWPWLEADGLVVAPGIPVQVGATQEAGPDGRYRRGKTTILRESCGQEAVVLSREAAPARPALDLLWFGDMERYLVRDGRLEVEDAFCRATCTARRKDLERMLVRGRRVEAAVLRDLPLNEQTEPTCLEISRERAATSSRWRDPEAVLRARVDIAEVRRSAGGFTLRSERGETAEFRCDGNDAGWRLSRLNGEYFLKSIELREEGERLLLGVELSEEIDLLRPGMRGRLAFDLLSDLVALQNS